MKKKKATAELTAPGVEVIPVSSVDGTGLDRVRSYLTFGKTGTLLGSSGVGKSTLVNALAGETLLKTQNVRENDSRGRHTTTHRELICLPSGGLILDTPGMRSLSLWEAEEGMDVVFHDVEELIGQCRFKDCSHSNEPGCAVIEALDEGRLDPRRWETWNKLLRELAHVEAKKDGRLRQQQKEWWKKITAGKKDKY